MDHFRVNQKIIAIRSRTNWQFAIGAFILRLLSWMYFHCVILLWMLLHLLDWSRCVRPSFDWFYTLTKQQQKNKRENKLYQSTTKKRRQTTTMNMYTLKTEVVMEREIYASINVVLALCYPCYMCVSRGSCSHSISFVILMVVSG